MEENNHSDDIMEENQGQPDNAVITDTKSLSILSFGKIKLSGVYSQITFLCAPREQG